LIENSLQTAVKDQQEMRAVAEKPRDAVVNFDTYQNLQQHRVVLPAIARLLSKVTRQNIAHHHHHHNHHHHRRKDF